MLILRQHQQKLGCLEIKPFSFAILKKRDRFPLNMNDDNSGPDGDFTTGAEL
jgi:hypothetical protein